MQLRQADHPISYPASRGIEEGFAKLPNIRTGLLEVVVKLDNGPAYSFRVPVTFGEVLKLTNP